MTAPRTVTVHTLDHGPVIVACPTWCLGDHPADGYRIDIAHVGAETDVFVPTSRGPLRLMSTALEQRPFVTGPPGRGVFVNVAIGSDHYPSGPHGLLAIGEALAAVAPRFEQLADRLANLRGAGQ